MTTPIPPKRGGIHPLYELYLGGSPLDSDYKPTESDSYSYATQRRNIKTIASIERDLTTARDSTTTLKFDGKLEPVVGSITEVGKERFLQLLERRVEEHGHETFYYVKYEDNVVNLFEHVHNVTLNMLTAEFFLRMTPTMDPPPYSAFDQYEKGDVTMSRLVCESLLTPAFYDKIFVRYGHHPDFKKLPGSCLLLMALETCNASVSHDIDGAAQTFADLSLDTYPGENVADLSNEGLRLIRIMKGGYALPVNTGSRLLQKVARTSCEEFNRKVYNLLDSVKQMEHKYKVLDPRKILQDPSYDKLGPLGLISTLHEMYGQLITDHDWPALATKLPQSNHAAANSSAKSGDRGDKHDINIKCFRCKGNHHVKDCPKRAKNKDRDADKDVDKDSDDHPPAKKPKSTLPAWRYVEPKDLTTALVDDNDKQWKFCTKCVCRQSGKRGLYLLSHFDSEHKDDYTPPAPANESNLASVDVPMGIPAATTRDPSVVLFEDDDPIEFQGAWCAAVSNAEAVAAFPVVTVDDPPADDASLASDDDDASFAAALASLAHLSSVERERFLQVEHDMFPGSFAPQVKQVKQGLPEPPHVRLDSPAFVASPSERAATRQMFCLDSSFSPWSGAPLPSSFVTPIPSVFSTIASWLFSSNVANVPATPSIVDLLTCVMMSALRAPHLLWMFFLAILTPMLSFVTYFIDYLLRCSPLAIGVFSGTLFAWEGMISLVQAICRPSPNALPRRERRRLQKLAWSHRYRRIGRCLPLMVMLPAVWMVLTDVITTPLGNKTSPFPCVIPDLIRGFKNIQHRITYLDRILTLDSSVWVQVNNAKATYLFQTLLPPSCASDIWMERPLGILAFCKPIMPPRFSTMDDCWVADVTPCAYGPSSVTSSIKALTHQFADTSISTDEDPSAFMFFSNRSTIRHPVIFDTGASLAITPDKTDFDGPWTIPKGDLRLGGMANGLKIEGMGPVTWTFSNGSAADVVVRGMAYYVPKATARLLSPQRLFDSSTGIQGGYEGDQQSFRLQLQGHPPLIVEYDDRNSLPIAYATIGPVPPMIQDPQLNLSLLHDDNQNLTGAQKLLLQWHCRFGHLNMPSVQRLFRAAPFLSAKFAASSKCSVANMRCEICEYAKAHRRPRHNVISTLNAVRDGALKVNHLKPGAHVSVDHFESRLLGRTFDSYGKATSATYKGGCLFVDHASGFLHVEHQLGFSAVETVRAKQAYEQMALHHGVVVEAYLTDSGAFKANAFVSHIREHSQRLRFCGANAHHKNGIAERAVQSVSNIARALILHASAHWKNGIDSSLWPMAVTYATHLYNHLPNAQGLCPADVFTGSTVPRHRLKDLHVCRCPIYVLYPHLQGGQELPRWEPRSRRGVFMGFSHLHSSEVPLVLNLETGSITPQYHVVFDDLFSTVSSVERENDPPDNWNQLCLENTTLIPTDDAEGEPNNGVLNFDWMTPEDRAFAERAMTRQDAIREILQPAATDATVTLPRAAPIEVSTPSPTSMFLQPPSAFPTTRPDNPSTLPPLLSRAPTVAPPTPIAPISVPVSRVPTPSIAAPFVVRRSSRVNKGTFSKPRYIDEAFLSSAVFMPLTGDGHEAALAYMAELQTCSDTGLMDVLDPRVYASKTPKNDADMPTFQQAMNGSDAAEYMTAMKLEIQTLKSQNTWVTVDRPRNKSVLKGTWAFKLKRLPDGTAYRHKARFCARGDMQIEGVDFFETYAPVVQWSTIRLLLSTVLTEGWTTRQVDYTNAFAQAALKEDVYVECPRLFGPASGTDKVLHLRKSLYGLRQAPRTFFEKLKAGLLERGWIQSEIDPCLFLKLGMICVVYVDDTIFASANIVDLDAAISSLGISVDDQQHTFALRDEGEVSAFLGIQIAKTGDNEFFLTQTGLIDKVLAITQMTDCNGCDTPSTIDPLHADVDGAVFDETWAYDVVIGMLMYISGNTRPDIAYAVHQAARFTHGARQSHAAGVKRILRYLKKTKANGLILKPGTDLRVDCYVDADFGGLFSVEDKQDPISVKSRTGYVITYRGAPLLWASKMQTQVALSTMEAEYIALSQSMRDLIPIREILKEVMLIVFAKSPSISYHSHCKAFDDTVGSSAHVIPQSTVFEDNDACLKFARMPKLTPRTKHIGIPYHWFRTQVERLEIQIERIDTKDQLADQFTKGLPVDAFRRARKRLMGW